MEKKYDVYGIGNPLIDLLSFISDDLLTELNLHKGIMHLIDLDRRQEVLSKLDNLVIAPGGSCANTMIATADFGLKSIFSGSVADDDYGIKFNEGMLEKGCITDLKINKLPTGSSIILISEDAERTTNTYLGSCQEYSIKDINEEQIAQSKFLYFTGYMWDTESQKEALEKAIEIAKKNKTQIVFDVADPFAVSRSKDDFIRIIKEDADFILANYEEAKMFTEKDNIEEILKVLMSYIGSGVVKVGKKGSYFFNDGKVTKIDAFEVKAVDTTGAGDIYAAGILYGLVRKFDDVRTGKIASYVAAKCVENVGARLEFSLKESIDKI